MSVVIPSSAAGWPHNGTATTIPAKPPSRKPARVSKPRKEKHSPQKFDAINYERNDEFKLDYELASSISLRVNQLIKRQVLMNSLINEDSRANIIRLIANSILSEHKEVIGFADPRHFNTWYSSSPGSTVNPNANLIPLSPLLNDSDAEYPASNPSPNPNSSALDSLTLPGISTNLMFVHGNNLHNGSGNTVNNSFVIPNQLSLSQIQNQGKQLPSFNSIQNSLPLSPTASAATLFGATSSLPNPNGIITVNTVNTNGTVNMNSASTPNTTYGGSSNSSLQSNYTSSTGTSSTSNTSYNNFNTWNPTLNPSNLLKSNPNKSSGHSHANSSNFTTIAMGYESTSGSSKGPVNSQSGISNNNNYLGALSTLLNVPGVSSPNSNSNIPGQNGLKSSPFIGNDLPLPFKLRTESDSE
ncbi:hypothetical protein CANTEDRAFT_134198 [Yamadazyma tenuis ATCC 10573]|uniref:Uncharacterized protein n=2 Tax=Candida tenuis TaxID=2315449 RepID=G3B169_CANTC|nr:uncharacterized protein CANTEDRAFT_134198 [Yamadazyma tenuis ATCC 10573]EGV64893.1 hypothetical protein CANTEDRAFT_134198 [Yamadazyma tenuis ATCC 10573]